MANELSSLHPQPGSVRKRVRLGRGQGSGLGKTSGKGTKGQKARAGYSLPPGFEGGQVPLRRRLPKFGFTNIFAKDFETINVGQLAHLDAGTVVDSAFLKSSGLVSRVGKDGVKILGGGDVSVALTVKVEAISASARQKIASAGGTVEDVA